MSIVKTPSKSEIFFVWFNRYAGVTIKTPSKTLVIDPVDVKPRDFKNVDAVLIKYGSNKLLFHTYELSLRVSNLGPCNHDLPL